MKYKAATAPRPLIPPYAWIPSYITTFQSSPVRIWNTVRHDWPKLLKVLRSASSPVANRPPKICIPNSAKMKMKRIRRTKSALMEAIELTRLLTRLPILAQYLVTLKALRSLMHLKTDIPRGGIISWLTRTNSIIELITKIKWCIPGNRQALLVDDGVQWQ